MGMLRSKKLSLGTTEEVQKDIRNKALTKSQKALRKCASPSGSKPHVKIRIPVLRNICDIINA